MTKSKIELLIAFLLLTGCHKFDKNDLPGIYAHTARNSVTVPAKLYLYRNNTYKVCFPNCEIGTYSVVSVAGFPDRVYFEGAAMSDYARKSGVINTEPSHQEGVVDYGIGCPCIDVDVAIGEYFEKSADGSAH
ncbi:MAG: hypothetical protein P4L64_16815 [Caulobacteraceae bacterium]|nr:hypothetical protein [Caulobacteraceae bacterium]